MEHISIPEFARRIGVSVTAVYKAVDAGRMRVQSNPTGTRKTLAWPQAQTDWEVNRDASRVSVVHVSRVERPGSAPWEDARPPVDVTPEISDDVSDYAKARTVKEGYAAQLLRLEYLEKSGDLLKADAVRMDAYKTALMVRDTILNIPDRIAAELAAEEDADKVHLILTRELRAVIEALRAAL